MMFSRPQATSILAHLFQRNIWLRSCSIVISVRGKKNVTAVPDTYRYRMISRCGELQVSIVQPYGSYSDWKPSRKFRFVKRMMPLDRKENSRERRSSVECSKRSDKGAALADGVISFCSCPKFANLGQRTVAQFFVCSSGNIYCAIHDSNDTIRISSCGVQSGSITLKGLEDNPSTINELRPIAETSASASNSNASPEGLSAWEEWKCVAKDLERVKNGAQDACSRLAALPFRQRIAPLKVGQALLWGGVGDGRHVLSSIIGLHQAFTKLNAKKRKALKVHLTLIDLYPRALARDLCLLFLIEVFILNDRRKGTN
ncbi:hypothetical protein EDD18DRAFT_1393733 [Armillaria luteobubalina]|uniref:DUF4470 domain-containing protein n=1 Tax=Armillaria luteobubalina TaxID=153913 RepID=A0AA39Q3X3_9AGAR|nr:hypothetical protein EDD18DRAFT_1393733 [Armillaria luteobubalina]